jgi:integrase
MAYIEKRERKDGTKYLVTVSCGYCPTTGKQVKQNKTFVPEANWTEAKTKKELQKFVVLFEESCKQGQKVTANIKFQTFAEQWLDEVASLKLKATTLDCYRQYAKVVYKAIGHRKLDKITAREIQQFVKDLSTGERHDRYRTGKLAASTIKNYVAFISVVFEYAKKQQILTFNPCSVVEKPVDEVDEREIYSQEEVQQILGLLFKAPSKDFHFAIWFMLAMYTGFRTGEVMGLEWRDIDFDKGTISVKRISSYTKSEGIHTTTPKTKTSQRTRRLPQNIMDVLRTYKKRQAEYAESLGDKRTVDCDRLFTKESGAPMHPNTPYTYFKRFCERKGRRFLCVHSMRHFNASAMISKGISVKEVQLALGHSLASTTLNTYCHEFQAYEAASKAVEDVIGFTPILEAS